MRTGANPAKAGLPAYQPRRLGVALITYIPFTEGYFEHSLDILKIQLQSLRAATPEPYDLLVFDNGSCAEVTAELSTLQANREIDWLILSRHNMGKAGAWNWIFSAMPNELICYSDSDVLFRPGWLEASLEILAAFPRAGMIAAQPSFFDVMEGQGQAHRILEQDPGYRQDAYHPAREIIAEYCLGIGASDELQARFESAALPAFTQLESGVQAVQGASHMQFLIPRQVARQVAPLPSTRGLLRTETMSLDFKTDELGYQHLSTRLPYVFHMGNTFSEYLHAETARIGLATGPPADTKLRRPARQSLPRRILGAVARSPRGQRTLLRLYNLLFRVLYNRQES